MSEPITATRPATRETAVPLPTLTMLGSAADGPTCVEGSCAIPTGDDVR
jgi:hypothetical protein